jgi:hypothetical protein
MLVLVVYHQGNSKLVAEQNNVDRDIKGLDDQLIRKIMLSLKTMHKIRGMQEQENMVI